MTDVPNALYAIAEALQAHTVELATWNKLNADEFARRAAWEEAEMQRRLLADEAAQQVRDADLAAIDRAVAANDRLVDATIDKLMGESPS